MEREFSNGLTDKNIRVNIETELKMEKEFLNFLMEAIMKDNFSIIRYMERVFYDVI